MMPVPGTEGHEPWMQLVGALAFVVTMGVLAALSNHKGRQAAAKDAGAVKAATESAARQATAMLSVQPTADRFTADALVQVLAGLTASMDRLNHRLDEQERERDAEKEAELYALRQWQRSIERDAAAGGATINRGMEGMRRDQV